jgi:hypothetical protein
VTGTSGAGSVGALINADLLAAAFAHSAAAASNSPQR